MYTRAFLLLTLAMGVTAAWTEHDAIQTNKKSFEQELKISSIGYKKTMTETKQKVAQPNPYFIATSIPETTAEIISVVTLETNNALVQFREKNRHPIASITKFMTAIIAERLIEKNTRIVIEEEDTETEGPAGNFAAGEIFSVDDLIKVMLVVSSNDAATALARVIGAKKFVDAMQQTARSLGMENTTFFDPTGLSSLNQSTAEDLAILVNDMSKNHENLLRITRAASATIIEQRSGQFRILRNINEFAEVDGFEGGKTGYTDEARGNLISLFRVGEHKLLIAILGSNDRFGDTRKLYDWAKTMLQ